MTVRELNELELSELKAKVFYLNKSDDFLDYAKMNLSKRNKMQFSK